MVCLSPQLGDFSFDLLSKSSLSAEGSNEAIVKCLTAGEPGDLSDPCLCQTSRQGELCSQGCWAEADLQSHL